MEIETCSCKGIRICRICEGLKKRPEKISYDYINIDDIVEKDESSKTKYFVNRNKIIEKIIFSLKNKNFEFNECKISSILKEIFKADNLFDNFYTLNNFFINEEEKHIIEKINEHKWIESQSGRRKQEYGPKINYKKMKISFENLSFPIYLPFLSQKIKKIDSLTDFIVREVGNLLYSPQLGSHIEPHMDHTWVWGNRIIGINLLSDTKMTFLYEFYLLNNNFSLELNIPIFKNSMYIMSESSRYKWKHGIKPENIKEDRLVMTLREFDEKFYKENKEKIDKYY